MEKLDIVRGMFGTAVDGKPFNLAGLEQNPVRLLVLEANHILALSDGKKRFLDAILGATKAFALCGTLDEAEGLQKELAFYSAIKAAFMKLRSSTTVDWQVRESVRAKLRILVRRLLQKYKYPPPKSRTQP